jgi:integral membrane protein (TIGR01906 family)
MMKWHKVIASLASAMVLIGILLTVVFTVCFDHSFYEQEYQANGQAEKIGMSEEDLMKSTDALLDYLQGKKDDIQVEAVMNGHSVEVFNERETLHMADVKELLDNAVKARDILLWGGAVILAAAIASAKREKLAVLKDAYKYSVSAIGAFIAVLGCWAAVDFYDFWVDFHYLFFDNTLFFLDPNTSIMINMFPENFFFDLVFRIILIVIIIIAVLGGGIHWLSVLKRRREKENDQCCSL